MAFNIGPVELIIILVIALLVIGPGKPAGGRGGVRQDLREFRKASTEMQEAVTSATAPPPSPTAAATASATPGMSARLRAAAPRQPCGRPVTAPAAMAAPALAASDTVDAARTSDGPPPSAPTATSGSPDADAESTPGA